MLGKLTKKRRPNGVWSGYSSEPKPLTEYLILIGVLNALIGATVVASSRSQKKTPAESGLLEFAILALATHKTARLISKDKVTSPLRAPFVRFEQPAGAAEVDEVERGQGLPRAIGDLATCPYCATPWAATALVLGYTVNPKATRTYSCILALTAISHFLNQLYARCKQD